MDNEPIPVVAGGLIAGSLTGALDPDHTFGELLFPSVSLAVAVILFEGAIGLGGKESEPPATPSGSYSPSARPSPSPVRDSPPGTSSTSAGTSPSPAPQCPLSPARPCGARN